MLTVLPGLAATTSVVITAADLENSKAAAMTNGKWFFYNDENDTVDNTLGSFVVGPGASPATGRWWRRARTGASKEDERRQPGCWSGAGRSRRSLPRAT